MVVAQLLAETQLADGHLDAPDRQLTVGKQNLQAAIGSSRFRLRLRHGLAHLDNAAELPQRTIGRLEVSRSAEKLTGIPATSLPSVISDSS